MKPKVYETKPILPHNRSLERAEVNIFAIQCYLYEISYSLNRIGELLDEIVTYTDLDD